jgi:GntR family transcriptional regulator, vanillate catabolism transcriptional regulator
LVFPVPKHKKVDSAAQAAERSRTSDIADAPIMRRIKEMILSGELAPGERVTEQGLAERLGISRTPIRHILPNLATQGLLEPVGKRGFAVKSFSEKECWEALELRALLEGQAARLLAQQGASPQVLAALDECLQSGDRLFAERRLRPADEQLYGIMNERFHRLVVDNCGSPLLKQIVDRLNLLPFVAPSVLLFDQVGIARAYDLLFRAHGCHHAIVEAIRERDAARAEALFREHAHQQRLSMFSRSRNGVATATPYEMDPK